MNAKERIMCDSEGDPKVLATKVPIYIRALTLLYKLEILKGPFHISCQLNIDQCRLIQGNFPQITI